MLEELLACTFLVRVIAGTGAANRATLRCEDTTAGDGLAPYHTRERASARKSPAPGTIFSQFAARSTRSVWQQPGIPPADASIPVRCRHVRLPVGRRRVTIIM